MLRPISSLWFQMSSVPGLSSSHLVRDAQMHRDMCRFVLAYCVQDHQVHNTLGLIANSHLALADQHKDRAKAPVCIEVGMASPLALSTRPSTRYKAWPTQGSRRTRPVKNIIYMPIQLKRVQRKTHTASSAPRPSPSPPRLAQSLFEDKAGAIHAC